VGDEMGVGGEVGVSVIAIGVGVSLVGAQAEIPHTRNIRMLVSLRTPWKRPFINIGLLLKAYPLFLLAAMFCRLIYSLALDIEANQMGDLN
jgi:hypothetical protein